MTSAFVDAISDPSPDMPGELAGDLAAAITGEAPSAHTLERLLRATLGLRGDWDALVPVAGLDPDDSPIRLTVALDAARRHGIPLIAISPTVTPDPDTGQVLLVGEPVFALAVDERIVALSDAADAWLDPSWWDSTSDDDRDPRSAFLALHHPRGWFGDGMVLITDPVVPGHVRTIHSIVDLATITGAPATVADFTMVKSLAVFTPRATGAPA